MGATTKKIKLNIVLLLVFLLIPFFSISGIKNNISSGIYQAWQIFAMCALLLIFLGKHRQIKLKWAVGLFSLYQFIIMFSSVYNSGVSLGIIAVVFTSVLYISIRK